MAAFLTSPVTTIYADGHEGTPAAKAKELPLSQFRDCVKHLIGSLRKSIRPVSIAFLPGAGGLASVRFAYLVINFTLGASIKLFFVGYCAAGTAIGTTPPWHSRNGRPCVGLRAVSVLVCVRAFALLCVSLSFHCH